MLNVKKNTQIKERLQLIMNDNKKCQKEINYLKIENKNIKEVPYTDYIPMLYNPFFSTTDSLLTLQEHLRSLSSLSKNLSRIDTSFSDAMVAEESNKEFFLVLNKFSFQK